MMKTQLAKMLSSFYDPGFTTKCRETALTEICDLQFNLAAYRATIANLNRTTITIAMDNRVGTMFGLHILELPEIDELTQKFRADLANVLTKCLGDKARECEHRIMELANTIIKSGRVE